MTKNSKQYDLEDRTLEFAKRVRAFVKRLPKSIGNIEDGLLAPGKKCKGTVMCAKVYKYMKQE